MSDLLESALAGERRAVAHVLSAIENDTSQGHEWYARLYPHAGRAHILGITGPPGCGKSTLVTQVAGAFRQRGRSVAIVAVDPTSPYSGGALLGDRVRMGALAGDAGVFVRSMASRGSLGGVARRTHQVVDALDACGFQHILVETVGAGQTEVDIARMAQTTVVVQVPTSGDEIQALKAGLLEIADILVVNKADSPLAGRMRALLEAMLDLGESRPVAWRPPIVLTIATTGDGVSALVDAADRHAAYLQASGAIRGRNEAHLLQELEDIFCEETLRAWRQRARAPESAALVAQVMSRQIDPYSAVQRILAGSAPAWASR